MKLPNWLKIVWWILLAGFFAFIFYQRYDSIISGDSIPIDIVIFLTLIALLTIPLFQEVNFFGVSLKKEIEKIKSDVKEQILNLRSDIQSTVNMKTEMSQQVQLLPPPTDAELQDIKTDLKSTLEQLKQKGLEKIIPKFEIPEDNRFLFEVRYTIENELRRIWSKWKAKIIEMGLWTGQGFKELEHPQSAFQIVSSLSELKIIDARFSSLIREVYRVCAPAIHGEEVSQTAVGFVRDVAPGLIASLKATDINWSGDKIKEE